MTFYNTSQVLGLGSIIFYINPTSKEINYAVDGEDNNNFYSYAAIKEGVIANPVHINAFDIWFTGFYSYPEIKGFAKLREDSSDEHFELTDQRIKRDAKKSFDNSVVGKITGDEKVDPRKINLSYERQNR